MAKAALDLSQFCGPEPFGPKQLVVPLRCVVRVRVGWGGCVVVCGAGLVGGLGVNGGCWLSVGGVVAQPSAAGWLARAAAAAAVVHFLFNP